MKKRGSHVGMVLSFVVFITFLVFLYSVVEPAIKTQKDEQALLNYLKAELIKKISANLTSASIIIDDTVSSNCIQLENLITETEVGSKLIVKNNSGKIFTAKILGDNLFIDREGTGNIFFKIYFSEEFKETEEEAMEGCEILNKESEGYKIGLIRTEKNIFETKIVGLIERYADDYGNLKNELKVPSGNDFGFGFIYNNGTAIETEEKNLSTNIYTEETPIIYINGNAGILSGFIKTKIW